MKKYIGLGVLMLIGIAVAVLFGNHFFYQSEQTAVINNFQRETPISQEESKIAKIQTQKIQKDTPQVSSQRLFKNLENLSFQRFTASERRRSRNYIINELKKLGWEPSLEQFQTGVNIFTEKRGTNSKAGAILLAAHYDTVFKSPGADDNASGIAVLLEIARIFNSGSTPRTLQRRFFRQRRSWFVR